MQEVVAANWRSLIKPKGVERSTKSSDTYGKFVIRPLERGFGITLGNALRRILLSSLQGCAINSIKIDGVLHEFSSIPGVVDDVTDIILNLKQVRIRTSSEEQIGGHIDKTCAVGETVDVTAADIRFNAEAEVLNPDLVIATLTEGGRFVAEVTADMGRGFVPGSLSDTEEAVIGTIPVDALHTPIQKVKYTVTNARVGHRTDYDKLTLEVWTDGSVTPPDAVAYAAKILKEQVQIFINFVEEPEPTEAETTSPEEEWSENLFKRVDELELSVRSANCLQSASGT